MQGISRQNGQEGGGSRKTLTFQVSEGAPGPATGTTGLRRLSQSTPNLMEKDGQAAGLSTKKLQSGLKKLSTRLKGSQNEEKLESAYSETNISAIPHYDLEFPSTSEQLISTIQKTAEYQPRQEHGPRSHVRRIYHDWKDLRRGVKYQVPPEFSLFWVVLGISPNKRFKMKLYFDPDRRQVYVNWDTQVGYITYFDGIRTYKVECMTTIERQDIWSMAVSKDKTLLISCNFEPVAQWKLISEQHLLCVQPLRFGGKYFLTSYDGLPPRTEQNGSLLNKGLSMVELDRSNSNTTESVASSEEWSQEWSQDFPEYDDTTIKFNSMQEAMDRYYTSVGDTPSNGHIDLNSTPSDLNRVHIQNIDHYRHNHSKHNPQMNTHLNHNYSQNGGSQLQSIYKNRARSGSSDNTQDMTKVKQLSNDLISLISQLESDFRENENSFKQKIKTLDVLSRNMVETLRTVQRESRDSKAEMRRREAEQLNSTIALEDRIARVEDLIAGPEYESMADGFADVIQQFIGKDGYSAPNRPKAVLPNFKQQIEDLTSEVSDKIKSLNKRIKVDQSSLVREISHIKSSIENFREKTQVVLLELESGVNSCAEENRRLSARQEEEIQGNGDSFERIREQLTAFDLKLNSLDAAIEELEERQVSEPVSEPVSEDLHYTTVEDLTSFGSHDRNENRRVSGLPSIQEESRLEELEKTCRDMMTQLVRQEKQIEVLREENMIFRSQLRKELGLNSPVKTDTVPSEDLNGNDLGPPRVTQDIKTQESSSSIISDDSDSTQDVASATE